MCEQDNCCLCHCTVFPLRYFTLFMNLLNDCSEPEDDGQQVAGRKRGMSRRLASLRHCTVLAMSNLLNANVDSGLMHSIGEHRLTSYRTNGERRRYTVLSPQHHRSIPSQLVYNLGVNDHILEDVFHCKRVNQYFI